MGKSKIQWTHSTWPVVTGCSHAGSPGCDNCYAARMAATRLKHHSRYEGLATISGGKARWTGEVKLNHDVLEQPLHWRKPRMVFIASMGDLFHSNVPFDFVLNVWRVMWQARQHCFQILTKRPGRMLDFLEHLAADTRDGKPQLFRTVKVTSNLRLTLPNVWLGVSVENQTAADERIPLLLQTPAAVRFVSCEPLLSMVDISPYLGYNIQKGGMRNGQRASSLQSGAVWGVEDRPDWANLEEKERQLETGRTQNAIGLSPSQKNDRRYKDSHRGASASLPALQGNNSSRHNDQSPKWTEGRQQTRESGIGNLLREHETCIHDWPEKSGRPEESCQQANRSTGRGNQGEIRTEQCNPEGIRSGIQCCFSDYIKDREGRTPPRSGGSDSGLYATSNEQKQTPKPQGTIQLVIVGGESGPGARPMHPDWARSLRDQCQIAGIPFFFKQHGAWLHSTQLVSAAANLSNNPLTYNWPDASTSYRTGKKRAGHLLDGRTWQEFPR